MSRRHHGRPHHARRPVAPLKPAPEGVALDDRAREGSGETAPVPGHPTGPNGAVPSAAISTNGHAPLARELPPPASTNGAGPAASEPIRPIGATAPQLRRFIKSRPYVPMHELRRRFGIDGAEDDVSPVAVSDGSIFVGLPEREAHLLGELLRGGEIGYELSLDPRSPIVVGLYPMRPVPRT
ncbi:MAG: hypothetical protein ACJ761_07205 [Chloroflexota bacterium]